MPAKRICRKSKKTRCECAITSTRCSNAPRCKKQKLTLGCFPKAHRIAVSFLQGLSIQFHRMKTIVTGVIDAGLRQQILKLLASQRVVTRVCAMLRIERISWLKEESRMELEFCPA